MVYISISLLMEKEMSKAANALTNPFKSWDLCSLPFIGGALSVLWQTE
jgi:hypothetical protein